MPSIVSPVSATIDIATADAFTMQGLYETIRKAFPGDPNTRVVGISLPLLGIDCKTSGMINPGEDIKEMVSKLFHEGYKNLIQPIWNCLVRLANILSAGALDEKLPVLNLSITDLFRTDIWTVVTTMITRLWNQAKDGLNSILNILNILGIPWPLFTDIQNDQKTIEYIVKNIISSFWDTVMKKIKQYIDMIATALKIYDAIYHTGFSITWEGAITAVLNKIADYLIAAPTIKEIKEYVETFAKAALDKATVTYGEIMSVINNFTIPKFGRPFDWILPLNEQAVIPNIDFVKILSDIKHWMSHFVGKILKEFIEAVNTVLSFFGVGFDWIKLNLTIKFCTIRLT